MADFAEYPKDGYGLIYKATSPSGKIYIGQTVKSLKTRIKDHFYYMSKNPDVITKWLAALRKYGQEIQWEIVEWGVSILDLDRIEQEIIKKYDSFESGYNGTLGGGGSVGRILSIETKNKIRDAHVGRKASEETRNKMRGHRRKLGPSSVEHRKNLSASKRKKNQTSERNGNAKLSWSEIKEIRYKVKNERRLQTEVAIEYNISKPTINNIIRNKIWYDVDYVPPDKKHPGTFATKLKPEDIDRIVILFNSGELVADISELFGICKATVSNVLRADKIKNGK